MRGLPLAFAAAVAANPVAAQQVPPDSLTIEIDSRTSILRSHDLAALPRAQVTVMGRDSTARALVGIPLRAVLERAGLDTAQVHGPALARVLLIVARDGYRVAFGLADLDSAITGRALLLAYGENGRLLDERCGPWQLIVPGDRHGRRSVRQVTTMRVLPPAP